MTVDHEVPFVFAVLAVLRNAVVYNETLSKEEMKEKLRELEDLERERGEFFGATEIVNLKNMEKKQDRRMEKILGKSATKDHLLSLEEQVAAGKIQKRFKDILQQKRSLPPGMGTYRGASGPSPRHRGTITRAA